MATRKLDYRVIFVFRPIKKLNWYFFARCAFHVIIRFDFSSPIADIFFWRVAGFFLTFFYPRYWTHKWKSLRNRKPALGLISEKTNKNTRKSFTREEKKSKNKKMVIIRVASVREGPSRKYRKKNILRFSPPGSDFIFIFFKTTSLVK